MLRPCLTSLAQPSSILAVQCPPQSSALPDSVRDQALASEEPASKPPRPRQLCALPQITGNSIPRPSQQALAPRSALSVTHRRFQNATRPAKEWHSPLRRGGAATQAPAAVIERSRLSKSLPARAGMVSPSRFASKAFVASAPAKETPFWRSPRGQGPDGREPHACIYLLSRHGRFSARNRTKLPRTPAPSSPDLAFWIELAWRSAIRFQPPGEAMG